MLTLFFAFAGACISFVYSENPARQTFVVFAARIAGIGGSAVLWFFEWRIQGEFLHLERRAAELEQHLGYDVYTRRTRVRIRMFWVTSVLFCGVILFWCASFFTS